MQLSAEYKKPTKVVLNVSADSQELAGYKNQAVRHLGAHTRIPGFRTGKAPLGVIEKHLERDALVDEFVNRAVNDLYAKAMRQEKLRPAGRPEVTLQKVVPFSVLQFSAAVEVVGPVVLPNIGAIKVAPKSAAPVTGKDVAAVLESLRQRLATRQKVDRPASAGDEVVIDFEGFGPDGKPISGAQGKNYPLRLGSSTFIPGFEEELNGLKSGDRKQFELTFPREYGVKALQNKKVTFKAAVKEVWAVSLPPLDDQMAQKAGPFGSLEKLKVDIRDQLAAERRRQARRDYEDELVRAVTAKTTVAIPESLVDDQILRMESEEKRNLAYRGQTWQEHLNEVGQTEQQHRDSKRAEAEERVRGGLVLSEIAEQHNLTTSNEEIAVRLEVLKNQYHDAAMRAELDKPQNREDIASRIITEKAIAKLKELSGKPEKA